MCEQLMLSFYNVGCRYFLFFFKQKTAYELLISDWSSDVCSSDLITSGGATPSNRAANSTTSFCGAGMSSARLYAPLGPSKAAITPLAISSTWMRLNRSEEHTSELQSLMRISYAVFCLKKKKQPILRRLLYTTIEREKHTR